jgi:multidrug efflux pump subunit AcrA (membrane-fusion protein)
MAVELAPPGEGAATGMRVPLAAVQQPRGGSPAVLVVGSDKRLRAVPVRLAAITGSNAIITGRLAPGDMVVAAGAEFLEAGLTVRPHRAQR